MQDVKLYTKCMSVGLRISDSRREWVQSGVIFSPENIFFKWCGSHLAVMHIQLPIETFVYGIILGLSQYHIALNVILEVREKCTIVVLIEQAE